MKKVILGNTGIEVSELNIGTGTSGWNGRSNQTDLGINGLSDLMLYAYDQGINFWDLADEYGSHPHAAQALKNVPRESVVITTKTVARNAEQAEKDIDRFLRELGTDYIDIVLMHCMMDQQWPQLYRPVMDVLSRRKAAGQIRAVGVSCHDFGSFKITAETPWVEVNLARINYAGTNMCSTPEKIIPIINKMDQNGIGVYGMKVLGCGKLTRDPAKAINFALDVPGIRAITLGFTSRREIDESLKILQSRQDLDQKTG